MTSKELRDEILSTYPPLLTLDNVRTILHISKRKAAWLLQNGYIKCQNNGKKTRQYQVDVNDLLTYIKRVESGKLKIVVPSGMFTSRPTAKDRVIKLAMPPEMLSKKPTKAFELWLDDHWYDCPLLLNAEDISKLTGYNTDIVNEWINSNKLNSVVTQNAIVITKEWLIDFYISEGYKIEKKSNEHIRLLNEFYKNNK